MADLIWAVLCYKVSIDKETNQVSMLDVLEVVTPLFSHDVENLEVGTQKAGIAQHMEFVCLWRRSDIEVPELGSMKLEIVSPRDKTVGKGELAIRLDSARRWRGVLKLDAFEFDGYGTYRFRVSEQDKASKWRQVASIPLEVMRQPEVKEQVQENPIKKSRRSARKQKT